jgi:polar amino acid transport system substrate-binding protein
VVTNLVPPIKEVHDGKLTGITGHVLIEVMKRSGHTLNPKVKIAPISQALKIVKSASNTIYPGLARCPLREEHYKWVGPVYSIHSGIIAKKSRALNLPCLDAAKGLTIASVIDSAPEQRLLNNGIPKRQLIRFKTPREAINALVEGRADGLLMAVNPSYHMMQEDNINPTDYETVLLLDTMKLYFAFNPDTETETIEEIQQALNELKKTDDRGNSDYLNIVSHYYDVKN